MGHLDRAVSRTHTGLGQRSFQSYHSCIWGSIFVSEIKKRVYHMSNYGISNPFQPEYGTPLTCQSKLSV